MTKTDDQQKTKVALIGYEGTITMVIRDNKVVPADDVGEILAMVPAVQNEADVDYHILSDVDSTNVVPDDWTKIVYFIAEHIDDYDAFVVTHGTNTMSYTAGAVELALGRGMKKPVVFTGSQLPLTVYGNDARFNLVFKEVVHDSSGNVKGNCDAELVLNVVRSFYEEGVREVIIVSGDGDFRCLVDFLIGKDVAVNLLVPNHKKCSILLSNVRVGSKPSPSGEDFSRIESIWLKNTVKDHTQYIVSNYT